MYIPKNELEKFIKPNDRVLDIGSWNDVFPRANVIIDINPYETRKNTHNLTMEHFNKESWYQADVNKIETWEKFKDKEFDFVICSHLLEDIRDPLFVCKQLIRVAKAGYIEVPTRFRECSKASPEDTVSGYDHHRWLVDIIDGCLCFTAKLHWSHTVDYLTNKSRALLKYHNFHYFGVCWNNSFSYIERCPKGEIMEGANLLYQFSSLDLKELKEFAYLPTSSTYKGDFLWVDQFKLPVELESVDKCNSFIDKYKKLINKNKRLFDFIGFLKF